MGDDRHRDTPRRRPGIELFTEHVRAEVAPLAKALIERLGDLGADGPTAAEMVAAVLRLALITAAEFPDDWLEKKIEECEKWREARR